MKKNLFVLFFFLTACSATKKTNTVQWTPYDETEDLAKSAKNESPRMRYKLIQSKVLDKNDIWKNVAGQISGFTETDYESLKPLILNQDIPTMQAAIRTGKLTYEKLTQWYLYRIVKFENDKNSTLNNIIAINPDAVKEARKKDKNKTATDNLIYGMPILLKDNIGMQGLATTAGAYAFLNNKTRNAFIVDRLQEKGAIILGKTNLSEWANYICLVCPNGYSAVGGQTLNPYGRKTIETGGSSSGSGSAMAANYAAAAVGTETSGSILSPSSENSLVGLKPTTGLLSRSGIVPISSTFDTPGPMTRNIIDNAIMLDAMSGDDNSDPMSKNTPKHPAYFDGLTTGTVKGLRFGSVKPFLRDSLYKLTVEKIRSMGGIIVEIEFDQANIDAFGTLLNTDMKVDLPNYMKNYSPSNIPFHSVDDILAFNKIDSTIKIPYGQDHFEGIVKAGNSAEEIAKLKATVHTNGVAYFEKPMVQYQLDFILSFANRSAGFAAAANYPCLTVPMGYKPTGEPEGITFIARPFMEDKLLKVGYAFEKETQLRKIPEAYN